MLGLALALFGAACAPGEEPAQRAPEPEAGASSSAAAPGGTPAQSWLGERPTSPARAPRSFRATSVVHYAAAPDRAHQLIATFALPDRARVELRLLEGAGERRIDTRLGDALGRFDPSGTAFAPLEGAEAEGARQSMDLRLATMLFPDGFDWGPGRVRADEKPGVEFRATPYGASASVQLVARLDEFAQLERVAVVRAIDGTEREVEALRLRTRTTIGERLWPRDMEFELGGVRVWNEVVQGVQVGVSFLDSFFLPDGAEGPAASARGAAPLLVDLPEVHERAVLLAAGEQGWAAARARAEVVLAEAEAIAGRTGPKVEPRVSFELGPTGLPVALRLRLLGPGPAPGFERRPPGRGVSLIRDGFARISANDLAQLAEAARAAGATASGPPYARALGLVGAELDRVQLVLPLAGEAGAGGDRPLEDR